VTLGIAAAFVLLAIAAWLVYRERGTVRVKDIGRLYLKEGDIVLLQVERPPTQAQAERIRSQFAELVSSTNKVAVLDSGIDVSVLTASVDDELGAKVSGRIAPKICSQGYPIDPAEWRSTRLRRECGCPDTGDAA